MDKLHVYSFTLSVIVCNYSKLHHSALYVSMTHYED